MAPAAKGPVFGRPLRLNERPLTMFWAVGFHRSAASRNVTVQRRHFGDKLELRHDTFDGNAFMYSYQKRERFRVSIWGLASGHVYILYNLRLWPSATTPILGTIYCSFAVRSVRL